MFILISLRTEIARSVNGPKLPGLRAEDAMAKSHCSSFVFSEETVFLLNFGARGLRWRRSCSAGEVVELLEDFIFPSTTAVDQSIILIGIAHCGLEELSQSSKILVFEQNQFWTRKIQIKYIDTKNQFADILWPREISHVMNGIIFCVCLTLAILVLPLVLKWCRKERKNRWRKSHSKIEGDDELVSRCCERNLDVLPFYCIRKPRKTQIWKSISSESANWAVLQNGTTRCVRLSIKLLRMECWWDWGLHWKSDELMEDNRGDLLYSHSTRTDSLEKIRWILTPKQNQKCR